MAKKDMGICSSLKNKNDNIFMDKGMEEFFMSTCIILIEKEREKMGITAGLLWYYRG